MLLPCVLELICLPCCGEPVSRLVSSRRWRYLPHFCRRAYIGAETRDNDGQQRQCRSSSTRAASGQGRKDVVQEVRGVCDSERVGRGEKVEAAANAFAGRTWAMYDELGESQTDTYAHLKTALLKWLTSKSCWTGPRRTFQQKFETRSYVSILLMLFTRKSPSNSSCCLSWNMGTLSPRHRSYC